MDQIYLEKMKHGKTYAAMDLDKGQRSIEAWYFMFSICFFKASLSMVARILASIRVGFDNFIKDASVGNLFFHSNPHKRELFQSLFLWTNSP